MLHGVGIVAQQVDRLLDLAQRLQAILAHLQHHDCRKLEVVVTHDVGGAAHCGHALLPGQRGPAGRGGARSSHGSACVLDCAHLRRAEMHCGVNGAGAVGLLIGQHLCAIDEHGHLCPQHMRLHMLQRCVKGRLQLFVVGRHGGIGNLHFWLAGKRHGSRSLCHSRLGHIA